MRVAALEDGSTQDCPCSGAAIHVTKDTVGARKMLRGTRRRKPEGWGWPALIWGPRVDPAPIKAALGSAQSSGSIWKPWPSVLHNEPHPHPDGPRRGCRKLSTPASAGPCLWALGLAGQSPGGRRMFKGSCDSDFVGKIVTIPSPQTTINTRWLIIKSVIFHYCNCST